MPDPETALMQLIHDQYGAAIATACASSSVPPAFLAALIANESGGNPNAQRFEPAMFLQIAQVMLHKLCLRPLIEKVRFELQFGGLSWEIDEFQGENRGLVLAEVELESEEQEVALPPWAGLEVSHDKRYSNASLVQCPFGSWK